MSAPKNEATARPARASHSVQPRTFLPSAHLPDAAAHLTHSRAPCKVREKELGARLWKIIGWIGVVLYDLCVVATVRKLCIHKPGADCVDTAAGLGVATREHEDGREEAVL